MCYRDVSRSNIGRLARFLLLALSGRACCVKVSSVCKLVPKFLRVYFDVLLESGPLPCIEELVPVARPVCRLHRLASKQTRCGRQVHQLTTPFTWVSEVYPMLFPQSTSDFRCFHLEVFVSAFQQHTQVVGRPVTRKVLLQRFVFLYPVKFS